MTCNNCGSQMPNGYTFCKNCGSKLENNVVYQNNSNNIVSQNRLICKKCGSNNINVQMLAEQKKRGLLMSVLWIIAAIFTCGLILLIPILIKKGSKTRKYVVCQSCGYSWKA